MKNKETMEIELANEEDIKALIPIYKESFTKHNIFEKSEQEIKEYLVKANEKNKEIGGGLLVAKIGNKVVGALLLKKYSEDITGNHTVWRFNHLAVDEEYRDKDIGTELIKAAENKIKENISKTAKIEINIAESEKATTEFCKKLGFKTEGTLKSHYRWKEDVIVMGKEID